MKRAFIFTMDAIMALVPVFIIVGAVSTLSAGESILLRGQFVGLHYAASDLAAVSEKSGYIDNMGEMFTNYTDLKKNGDAQWTTERNNLLDYINETLLPLVREHRGFAVEFWGVYENGTSYLDVEYTTDNRTMTGQARPYEDESATTLASVKLATGYEKDVPLVGYVARAWIDTIQSKITTKSVWGDIVGPSVDDSYCASNVTIRYNVTLPMDANISEVSWLITPMWTDSDVDAYVNGNLVFSGPISANQLLVNSTLYPYVQPGYNDVMMVVVRGTGTCPLGGGDDGSTHFDVTYLTSELTTPSSTMHYLETVAANDGIMYEKPIFVPYMDITSMNVHLNVTGNRVRLYFRWRGTNYTIDGTGKNPVAGIVEWDNTEIETALNTAGVAFSDLTDEYFSFIFIVEPSGGNSAIDGTDSYTQISGTTPPIPYGNIEITKETPVFTYSVPLWGDFYRNVEWQFFVPNGTTPYYAKWLLAWFYSCCTPSDQRAYANGIELYNYPASHPFVFAFARFGYTQDVAGGVLVEAQTNSFELQFGNTYAVSPSVSYGEYVYLVPSRVPFGATFPYPGIGFNISVYYDGDQDGYYNLSNPRDGYQEIMVGGGGINVSFCDLDPDDEALEDAFLRLMDTLNFVNDNNNGDYGSTCSSGSNSYDGTEYNPVDLVIEPDVLIESYGISGVPFMWGPIRVRFRVWE